jgi:probable phosphoglycerate mutase
MTEEGFAQARALAKYLRVHWQPIHLILTSDLRRAAETTAELLKEVQVPMQYAPAWREMNNGDLAGLPNALAEERYPGLYFSSLAMDEPYPGGESPRQVFERISRAFEALCQKMITHQLPGNVAVVTHGGVISIVYHLLKGLSWSNTHPSFPTAATGIHEISYLDGAWRITLENDIRHLNQD